MTPEELEFMAHNAIGGDEVLALCALVRAQALEDAARVCEEMRAMCVNNNATEMAVGAVECAAAIRALGSSNV